LLLEFNRMTEPTIGRGPGRLAILAAILASLLVLELSRPIVEPISGAIPLSRPAAPTASPRPSAPGNVDTAAILARPLFAASRRPAAASAEPVTVAATADPPRLAGVIVSPNGARAIFASDEGRAEVVANGGSIGVYVVKTITPDAVLLVGPGGERGLHITFDPKMRVVPHALHASTLDTPG
jgi:hypothetical protein